VRINFALALVGSWGALLRINGRPAGSTETVLIDAALLRINVWPAGSLATDAAQTLLIITIANTDANIITAAAWKKRRTVSKKTN
jgi:hypothetical protein